MKQHRTNGMLVHEVELATYSDCHPKKVFIAFQDDEGVPQKVVATAVVTDSPSFQYIEWLEVASGHRRQGIGTAMMDLINKLFPYVQCGAGTEDGYAFLASLGQEPTP